MNGNRIIICILLFISANLFGQDTILFRNGEVKVAKIEEVGVSEIKYHRFNMLDGPVFISSKNEITRIKYKAGNIDSFAVVKVNEAPSQAVINAMNTPARLALFRGTVFSYKGIPISNDELELLIATYPNQEVRQKLIMKWAEVNDYVRKSRLAPGIALPVGFAIPLVSIYYALVQETTYSGNGNNSTLIIFSGVVGGAAVRITGAVLQKINKNKAIHAREELIAIYNSNL